MPNVSQCQAAVLRPVKECNGRNGIANASDRLYGVAVRRRGAPGVVTSMVDVSRSIDKEPGTDRNLVWIGIWVEVATGGALPTADIGRVGASIFGNGTVMPAMVRVGETIRRALLHVEG